MSDRNKIITMYVGIAIFAVVLVTTFSWLRSSQEARELVTMNKRIAADVGRAEKEEMLTLQEDLVATNQDGETVRLSDLSEKVFLVAEFFAECPMCAVRNGEQLVKFYQRYKDHPDFHVVCVSVDPETDDVERLREYAQSLGADSSNWWFLTGPREVLHSYMEKEMKFLAIRERQNELEIAEFGRFAHDMGLAVFGKGLVMLEKKDLFFAKEQSQDLYDHFEGQLIAAIEKGLEGDGEGDE